VVEAVHVDLQRAENAGEPRAVAHLHVVRRDVPRPALEPRLAVIEGRARLARDVLVQAAAERHVEHLEAATDRKQGDVLRERPARQLDLERVARGGDFGGGRVRRLPEARWVDVAAPGQQHPVHALEDLGARGGRQLGR
jgi:hypothetical protein